MTEPKTTPPALLLDRLTVSELLDLGACIEVVERCFADHARGKTLAPGLLHGGGVGGEFHIKAGGILEPLPAFACKVNGGFFSNRVTNGLPNIQGLILLYEATTGTPLAVMESATVTVLRTGAATAVATKHLARPGSRTATIAGSGTQGAIQLRSLARVLPLEKAWVWSRDVNHAAALAARLQPELGFPVQATSSLTEASRLSDVVVTCTPATKWILGRDMVRPGTLVVAVGADSPDKQEIEPALLASSGLVTDITEQCARVGDLHHAITLGLMNALQVRAELGQVIAELKPGRMSDDELIVFDSTGTALQDAAAARLVYERAIATDRGQRFAFWGS
jgi:alanine dehydrogenase